MADNNEVIDPNDLDSIDALLDEAEQTSTEQDPLAASEQDSIDSLLSEAEEASGLKEEDLEIAEDDMPDKSAPKKDDKKTLKPDADNFIAKRAEAERSGPQAAQVTASIDSLKKMFIIFGGVMSVLLLVAIGIGVWAALAASSAGLDEETLSLIEVTQARSAQNGVTIEETNKAIVASEKKLDALGFQLDGLMTDFASLKEHGLPAVSDNGQVATDAAKMGATVDSALSNKVSAVNRKMNEVQRRVNEVNRRIKDVQKQYKNLSKTVKSVEEHMVIRQKALDLEKKALVKRERRIKKEEERYRGMGMDAITYDDEAMEFFR